MSSRTRSISDSAIAARASSPDDAVRTSYPRGARIASSSLMFGGLVVDDEHARARGSGRSCRASQLEEVTHLLGKRAHADRLLDVPVEARRRRPAPGRRSSRTPSPRPPGPRGSVGRPDLAQRLGAVDPGQLQVHQDQVRGLLVRRAGRRPRPRSPRSPRSRSRSARPAPASGSSGCPRPPGSGSGSCCSPRLLPGRVRCAPGAPTAASAVSSSSRLTGLTRYAAGPSAAPRARSSTIDTTITGMSRVSGSAFSAFSTAQPSMPGSRMSSSTASGRARRTASSPD